LGTIGVILSILSRINGGDKKRVVYESATSADTPENVDSENVKLKIGYRPLLYQLFSKRDKIHKNWLKLAKISKT
jgi:hypothetical protein